MSCLVTDITVKRDNVNATAQCLGGSSSNVSGVTSPIIANGMIASGITSKVSTWRQVVDATAGIICSIRDLVKSAFTRGYWINDRPWMNEQTWKNKP